jgi:cytochrome P450
MYNPDHTRMRSLVQKAFLRTSVERWADAIARRVRSLLQAGQRAGQMDFMWDFAHSIGFRGGARLPFAIPLKLCGYSSMLGHQLH